MTIGQVAKQSGLAASAIRFYESVGVLPRPVRVGGQRRYDPAILERLAVLERAKACGYTVTETKRLFYGFRQDALPSERWRMLARNKLVELDELAQKVAGMQKLLRQSCECRDFTECGRRIMAKKRMALHTRCLA